MGRTPEPPGDDEQPLFPDLPEIRRPKSRITRVEVPLWTENKALLIAAYLLGFCWVTRHGAYIDGFAAPQSRDHTDADAARNLCAARLALHNNPPFLRNFWLCDADEQGVAALEAIKLASPVVKGRTIDVLHGDFNIVVERILESGAITDTTATFCLLDQRTFECHWATLEKLARHKQNGHKIELFYFLGTSWLDRAFGGTKDTAKIERWWGGADWTQLVKMTGAERADAFANRFAGELGYEHVRSWPIRKRGSKGGPIMYYMIHCSDHPRAPDLMDAAYRAVARSPEPEQIDLEDLLRGKGPPAATAAA